MGDGSVTAQQFKTKYKEAIDSLRSWGYTVPIVIDASNWGQNVDIIFNTWKEITSHDTLKNILFSVHSYWSTTENYNRIVTESINEGLPVIIGEGPSTTAYPTCQILDFETGLDITGRNDIGWLSWSWGAVDNGHCVPNFDHTSDGKFGEWETEYAATLMVEHEYSLMRTASRPASFYDDDTVRAAGIYITTDINNMIVGDSINIETLILPVNADNQGYSLQVTGDTEAVSYNPETGWMAGKSTGAVTIKAVSHENASLSFTRNIDIIEMPVSAINIEPSHANMFIGDTIYIEVAVLPENATFKDYIFGVTDENSVIEFDETTGMVVARDTGTAMIKALWTHGDVEGVVTISVSIPTVLVSQKSGWIFNIYPNPNNGLLYIASNLESPYHLMIFDLLGNKIIDSIFTGNTNINTTHLAPGYYEIVISLLDETIRHKMIKL